jgi:hypothetical protein
MHAVHKCKFLRPLRDPVRISDEWQPSRFLQCEETVMMAALPVDSSDF